MTTAERDLLLKLETVVTGMLSGHPVRLSEITLALRELRRAVEQEDEERLK